MASNVPSHGSVIGCGFYQQMFVYNHIRDGWYLADLTTSTHLKPELPDRWLCEGNSQKCVKWYPISTQHLRSLDPARASVEKKCRPCRFQNERQHHRPYHYSFQTRHFCSNPSGFFLRTRLETTGAVTSVRLCHLQSADVLT